MKHPIFDNFLLPEWAKNNNSSAMEQLLSYASNPGFISFALGLPTLELFPTALFQYAIEEVIASGSSIFQYNPPLDELKSQIVDIMSIRGVTCHTKQILLTAGAQQGISLVTRLLLDRNGIIIVEELAYPGLLQAIKPFSPEILTVNTDSITGIDVEAIERILKKGIRPTFLYLVADGGNPHTVSISHEKRTHLAALAHQYGMPIIEDDPYGFLNYQEPLCPIKKAGGDWVFYIGSFAKLLAPSLRVGWIVAPECMITSLSSLKESSDINTCTFTQHAITVLLRKNLFKDHVKQLSQHYLKKRDQLIHALTHHFSSEIQFNIPDCGFFVWVDFTEKTNTSLLLKKAMEHQVAFIPSKEFAATDKVARYNGMRLNFSNPNAYEIDEGIRRLSCAFETINQGV